MDLQVEFTMHDPHGVSRRPYGHLLEELQVDLSKFEGFVIQGQCQALRDSPEGILRSADPLGPYGFSRQYDSLNTSCPEVAESSRQLFCDIGMERFEDWHASNATSEASSWEGSWEVLQPWEETCSEDISTRAVPLIKSTIESSLDLSDVHGLSLANGLLSDWEGQLDDDWLERVMTRRDTLDRNLTNGALEEALSEEEVRLAKKIIEEKVGLMGESWVTSSQSRVASLERKVERRRAAEQAAREADPAYREARYFECADRVKREQGCYADDIHDPRWHPGCIDALIVAMDRCKHWE